MTETSTLILAFGRSSNNISRTTGGGPQPVILQKTSQQPPRIRLTSCARTSLTLVYLIRDMVAVSQGYDTSRFHVT
jgi:hypothetical protein